MKILTIIFNNILRNLVTAITVQESTCNSFDMSETFEGLSYEYNLFKSDLGFIKNKAEIKSSREMLCMLVTAVCNLTPETPRNREKDRSFFTILRDTINAIN